MGKKSQRERGQQIKSMEGLRELIEARQRPMPTTPRRVNWALILTAAIVVGIIAAHNIL